MITKPRHGHDVPRCGELRVRLRLGVRVARCAKTNRWWDHEYGEEKAGDMIEIILGLAWMAKCKTPDHQMWRDAVEDLARKTEKLVSHIQRTHHRYFAQRVKQALLRIKASVLPRSV